MGLWSKLWNRLFGRALDRGLPPLDRTDPPKPFYDGGFVKEAHASGEVARLLTDPFLAYDIAGQVNENEPGIPPTISFLQNAQPLIPPHLLLGLDPSRERDMTAVNVRIVNRIQGNDDLDAVVAARATTDFEDSIRDGFFYMTLDVQGVTDRDRTLRMEQERERRLLQRRAEPPAPTPAAQEPPKPVLTQNTVRRFKLRSKPTSSE